MTQRKNAQSLRRGQAMVAAAAPTLRHAFILMQCATQLTFTDLIAPGYTLGVGLFL